MELFNNFMLFLPLYLLGGAVTGLVAGLFGLGGGVVLVPLLYFLFTLQGMPEAHVPVMAAATSLSTIIATAAVAGHRYHYYGSVDWEVSRSLLPGFAMGALAGSFVATVIPAFYLKLLFALYLWWAAWRVAYRWQPHLGHRPPHLHEILPLAGFGIGMISAMLGVGGGTMTVPLLIKFGFPMPIPLAVSVICTFPAALIGTLGYIFWGWNEEGLPWGSLGYVYLPAALAVMAVTPFTAPLGVRLAHLLPGELMKRLFAGLLFFLGGRIFWTAVDRFLL